MKKAGLFRALELPENIDKSVCVVTVTAFEKIRIENLRSLVEYERERIRINTKEKLIRIEGESLEISSVTDDYVEIEGGIYSVSFE